MDFIKLLIKQSRNCFLCFKESSESIKIDDNLEIHNLSSDFEVTLRGVVNYLFPFYEIISAHACNHCTDLILKVYLTIKSGLEKLHSLDQLIETIFNNIDEKSITKDKLYISLVKEENTIAQEQNTNVYKKEDIKVEVDVIDQSKEPIKVEESTPNQTKTSEAPSYNCHFCSKKCKSRRLLDKHLYSHSNVICPYCQKTLKNDSHYKIHIKNHKKPVKKILPLVNCQHCSYKTVNTTRLQSHINKFHLKIKPFVCDTCNKGFYSKSNLVQHLIIHDTNIQKKKLVCEICGEKFSYKKTLESHLSLHNGKRPYKCDVCSHTFITNSRKNEHIKRKHSEKLFSCNICQKKYSLQKDLNRHCRQVHSV